MILSLKNIMHVLTKLQNIDNIDVIKSILAGIVKDYEIDKVK